jgi:uncharacterized phage-associated protein
MATADDVAAYIISKRGPMPAMKLQKLVYYSQAWHLVWEDAPLFADRIEAWANGPVVPALYRNHRGQFTVEEWSHGNADGLSTVEARSVDAVLAFYGEQTAFWLSELTHREAPWADARGDLGPGERSDREITQAAMAEFYGSLV